LKRKKLERGKTWGLANGRGKRGKTERRKKPDENPAIKNRGTREI